MPTPTTDPRADPRGARFAAALTGLVLVLVLVTPAPVALVLLAGQTAVFAVGALLGPARTPYAVVFRRVVKPRIGPPPAVGDPHDGPPQRFAQTVGLVFAGTGLALLLLGASTLGLVAVGFALVAALLNAVLGLCLGCEAYLLVQRARHPAPRTS